jgi:hypothetical protein
MAENVLDKIDKKELKLGQPVDVAVKNIDDNFVLLFDAVDALEEAIPTELPNPKALKFGSKTYDGRTEQTITKADIGLGNVANVLAIPDSDRNKPSGGVPTLDENGRVADSNKLGGKEASYYTNYKNITGTPTALKNPKALTVGSKTYDGSSDVTITKDDLGLSLIENTTYVRADKVGAKNGVASLGTDGKVPAAQLPSFVDDVLEYTNRGAFPTTGETGKIYVDIGNGKTYRWGGTTYVEISSSLALGTTSSTAFAGDRGLALEDKSINGYRLGDKQNIYLSLNDIADGGGFVRVKSGGDVTISNGVITVQKVGGQTADQIGKVKDVQVNGVSKLENGVANITIDSLTSDYQQNISANTVKEINGTNYYGFYIPKSDTEFEVYNYPNNEQIITQKIIEGSNVFIACSTTSGGTYTLRKMGGNGVGGGGVTTDMLNAIAERLQPYTKRTTESFRLNSNEYEATGDPGYWGVNFTRTVNAPAYSKFTAVTVTKVGESTMNATTTATISGDGKTATISVDGGIKASNVDISSLPVTYEHTTTISF